MPKVCMPTSSGGLYSSATRRRMGGEGVSLQSAILGKGTGSVLLDGGMGGQSSYANVEQYAKATGRVVPPPIKGQGLERLSEKIQGLSVQLPKKKRNNIHFDM